MSTTRGDTRDRILTAARRLLVEHGYQGAGVDAIARAAGISRQAIYLHHFATKADLLLALVDHVDDVERVHDLFFPVAQATSGVEALGRLVEAIAQLWPRVHDIATILESARLADSAAEIAWESRARVRRTGCEGLMGRLKREGQLNAEWTVVTAADFTLTVLSHQSYVFLVRESGWTTAEFAARLKKILFTALLVEQKPKAPRRARTSK